MNPTTPQRRLGAVWDGSATTFSVFSDHASRLELCLFEDPDAHHETRCIPLDRDEGGIWRARLPEVRPGQLYGYRADGPWDPRHGQVFNPAKLLVDPWARAVTSSPRWHPALLGFQRSHPERRSREDSAPYMPRCVVVDDAPAKRSAAPAPSPRAPWAETVIYECHVKGLTRRHPQVPAGLRGTYRGLATEPVLTHLRRLGITTVELMPVHQSAPERHLGERGLTNYWGYSPLALFAPHAGYASDGLGAQRAEFRDMVRTLHDAGLEVLIDVVLNHTAEGGRTGPTFSLKGLDNATYYRQEPAEPARYQDFTGCGNTLDVQAPAVREMLLACLRQWVEELHVDGFRFDLAPSLGRDREGRFDPHAAFFRQLAADPVLSRVKLIAEPWDLAPEGHRLGRFPAGWSEWNDRFRDTARAFWRGDPDTISELATRWAGSRDLFDSRSPRASVNFVTCHDGFPLADLVRYEQKHNEANGENNRDGTDHNLSRNWGVEGPTDDPEIRRVRERVRRSLLATVALAWGVPLLSHGDEVGRTQGGNNNAYCQDNEIAWVDWQLGESERQLLDYTRRLFTLRQRLGIFGESFPDAETLRWYRADGREMTAEDWEDGGRRGVAMRVIRPPSEGDLMLLLNGSAADRRFELPGESAEEGAEEGAWHPLLTSAEVPGDERLADGGITVLAHSLDVLVAGLTAGPVGSQPA